MYQIPFASIAALVAVLSLPGSILAQTADFGAGPVHVVTIWEAEDKGDTSGKYRLVTSATDERSKITLEHALSTERDAYGEEDSEEVLRALEGKEERFHGSSDPTDLGPYADAAMTYVLPFNLDYDTTPQTNYRVREKQAKEIIHGLAPAARVYTKAGSDNRTRVSVQVEEPMPADRLAELFVEIRDAFRDAGLGLAQLKLEGDALAPETSASASAGDEAAAETP